MGKFGLEIKWAIRFILANLAWMIFEKMMGWHDEHIAKHAIYTNLFILVTILIYVLALRDKRKIDLGGKMTWREGFNSGIVISVIVAFFSPIIQYVNSTVVSPDYFNNLVAYAVETGNMSREIAEGYFSLGSYMLQSFFGNLTMGIVTSAAVAFFVKKQ